MDVREYLEQLRNFRSREFRNVGGTGRRGVIAGVFFADVAEQIADAQ